MIRYAAALVCLLSATNTYALVDPDSSRFDSRIKTVQYNPDDVYRIDSIVGVGTTIILDPSENYVTHTFGDSEAWAIKNKRNYYTIKPKAPNGDTNLFLATDKRSYTFDIRYHEVKYPAGSKDKFDKSMTFVIRFTYPEIEEKKKKERDERDKVNKSLKILDKSNINLDYVKNGDGSISPINVWDNGVFTYFKFAPGQLVPVIFAVDPNGDERRVNFTACTTECMGNVVVAQAISNTWYLRRAKSVAGVYRGKSQGLREYTTGTTTPSVKRVLKDDQ